ncbi:5-oxoprolinase subunit C family protein [Maribacter cobaltidurans]|uniref:Allophanate hydrolase n=1 Tax=Maribacter cobaltidurans TaxID=1178778 RepID=A0A223VAR2_9FLAO|nr:biotin-dependent carboxyltransferase family protein [Maribacter cobaltidurans]ASV32463.1 allophanate hydrolase [Maribacter cobaltidurans]GGD75322.1 urea carboxylase [Maribacter cobaltidurans]
MLKVLKSGFFTSVQDMGRFHHRNKGVPVSGCMDQLSVFKANTLLENDPNSAVLEITMTGPTLQFEKDTFIVLAGALITVTLNNEPVQNYKVYKVKAGDILSYGKLKKGFRFYLAVKGGFNAPVVLGSQSFYKPITKKGRFVDGDTIPYKENKDFSPKISEIKVDSHLDETVLEVHKAPEYDVLSDRQLEALFSREFTISKENNRMAYQLSETIETHSHSILTSATLPGTVQLTPAGKLIILMKDGQTTGGYPRILQLSDKSISVLSQKREGNTVSFKFIQSEQLD